MPKKWWEMCCEFFRLQLVVKASHDNGNDSTSTCIGACKVARCGKEVISLMWLSATFLFNTSDF